MTEEHSSLSRSTVLVTGGSGGLASQILQLFSQRGCKSLHSIDLRQPSHLLNGVTYHLGDLTDVNAMRQIFHGVKPDVVIHTASPKFDTPSHIMYKVNVEGTRNLVQIAQDADETYPIILGDQQPEFYVHTKALAEIYVLSQNRRSVDTDTSPHFLTCAIRPSGIFGVGDLVVLPGILHVYFRGQTKVQIGDNKNLFDFTENTNVAYGHYLAAAALVRCQNNLPEDDAKVDGEAFFITNDEPRCFWDFTRLVWGFAGDTTRPEQVWVISRTWALLLAGLLEWIFWALRLGQAPLTRTKVRLSCMTRYFCIDKAKKRLGYKPLVGLEDGLRTAVEDCVRRRMAAQSTPLNTGNAKEKGQ
ncbi:erg26, C-3 sterol dehydrogenase [Aspergillus pseudoviridinutans]|uniref:Erg26, C-3 sterol dehydrogenase n=1 Tax=Aspergillus pseudoviridinutans TaxID=1517512 RepID=A0A9P3B407_9EURO|nr:erg26, C-3 sterol dehydrogenase [Aspergillus pseudoviridinutans]GIJ82260.1 erg26, C-3 sterol dehydrogenase [Aspergillus pseudoviridinutans]